jgi:hypothetical protein
VGVACAFLKPLSKCREESEKREDEEEDGRKYDRVFLTGLLQIERER